VAECISWLQYHRRGQSAIFAIALSQNNWAVAILSFPRVNTELVLKTSQSGKGEVNLDGSIQAQDSKGAFELLFHA